MKLVLKTLAFLILLPAISVFQVQAQTAQNEDLPNPRNAFLRSLAMPGWGHYYVDNNNWNRGKYHMAGEVVLILSYFGLDARANSLENDFYTLALSKAGTELSDKSREYLIAIGSFDNLDAYNQEQLRLRNWDNVFPDTPEYRWNWENRDLRNSYESAREKVDRNRSQLPALVALMVSNRLVSGLSAFIRARDMGKNLPEASFSYVNGLGEPGATLNLRFNF
ncbi:hypothetical protein [Gracilimonas sp.]|uniref:hypothetical protein n=1 Tax=Gracilimonas sp. TaxID=1974203 RepID=UPI00287156AD|nr:hypothetical protein [Gracilimonas sp.]